MPSVRSSVGDSNNSRSGECGEECSDEAGRMFLLTGYTHLQHVSSSATHETFVGLSEYTKELVQIRVYALEQLRRYPLLRDRVERGVLVARTVNHPNIVQGLPAFVSESDLFVVEEHCVGGELFATLDAYYRSLASATPTHSKSDVPCKQAFECLSLNFVRRIMRDLMGAVHYLHTTCGVVHRGIKLESIFLDDDNHAKLGRLGTCAAIPARDEGEGMLQLCCASRHYAAPELVMGWPYKGELVDVWAAGVVLFVMLTGRFPFEEGDGDEDMLFTRICTADEVLLAHPALALVPDPLAIDLVRNMLRLNPDSRLTVVEVQKHPFLLTVPAS
ncbi:serine/threonine protein kinase [Trypanosoma grayi]|uniref:serine/threonine protein kinase n=1 Tax=Trypanosoma grayi TaxID=71804 RepID=UPI0004F461F3|nr:serine/threonine protein kinase [Trypanosoma grayi]KEG11963.1 serine/threonine protein kinase [Trypanosoma grayi]